MYWIYLFLFIVAVLVPDLLEGRTFAFLSENRLEELAIFVLGMAGFLIFIFKEHQLSLREDENVKDKKKLFRATKDLVDSYSYIGEVNRKMEIVMQIGLGLADKAELSRDKEKEIYNSILAAASSLMNSKKACLRFVDTRTNNTQMDFFGDGVCSLVKNADLAGMGENVNFKKVNGYILASSLKEINSIKCYLVIEGYSELEADNANNQELLKFLASQGLFLYAYMAKI
ncbi:MAG: hypothetical protein WC238_03195 [Parcubacteria group bacterium]